MARLNNFSCCMDSLGPVLGSHFVGWNDIRWKSSRPNLIRITTPFMCLSICKHRARLSVLLFPLTSWCRTLWSHRHPSPSWPAHSWTPMGTFRTSAPVLVKGGEGKGRREERGRGGRRRGKVEEGGEGKGRRKNSGGKERCIGWKAKKVGNYITVQ